MRRGLGAYECGVDEEVEEALMQTSPVELAEKPWRDAVVAVVGNGHGKP